ncbi:MAG: hydratase [SAR116 cluster bacterium]|nr:hydratase [Paracoccaceae bacterium]RCL77509.1 MAG: hydratase [SAR116 cluster bacterium]HCJ61130.1 hydratase [Alphaproteobacteria bacterium]|tara:strand:- start:6213 stop:7025 length:813 start_codon:yes stop_codon:yes gene_type:complete
MTDQMAQNLTQAMLSSWDTSAQWTKGQFGDLAMQEGYETAAEVAQARVARGEQITGIKIGFTNTAIWPLYGVDAPMWGRMYDGTVLPSGGDVYLDGLTEPRIEPEIMFMLKQCPLSSMDDEEILSCISHFAHGFEIVQSPFTGWQFTLPEAVAAGGLHGRLILGQWQEIDPSKISNLAKELKNFTITLEGSDGTHAEGAACNIVGEGPIHALRYLLQVLESQPSALRTPLGNGSVVTTGTLTDAFGIKPGQTWRTTMIGLDVPGANASFV